MKDNNPADNLAWRVIWRQLISSVGSQARMLRRSMLALLLAAFMQGIAFACLYPIIDALLRGDAPQLLNWAMAFSVAAIVTLVLRWYGLGFEYRGHLAQATHELRLRLGEQLRRVPLEKLQRGRAGEMNALLLGSVDENLNYVIAIANILLLTIVTPLTASLATLWIDWRLGLVMLLIFPLLVPFYYWRRPAMRRQMQTLGEAHQRLSGDIVEFAQGMMVLRTCGSDADKSRALLAHFNALENLQTRTHRQGAGATMLIASSRLRRTGSIATGPASNYSVNSNASSATPTAPRWYLPAIWGVPSTAAAQNRRWASRNGASRKRRRSG